MFEEFEFPYSVVYPPELNAGELHRNYDVLVFPDGMVGGGFGGFGGSAMSDDEVPEQFRGRMGNVDDATVPALRDFSERGGAIIAIGSSTRLGSMLGLPVSDHLVSPDTGEPYSTAEYYIPGSILEIKVEQGSPLTHGLGDRLDVMFQRSPVFSVDRVRGRGADPGLVRRFGSAPKRMGVGAGEARGRSSDRRGGSREREGLPVGAASDVQIPSARKLSAALQRDLLRCGGAAPGHVVDPAGGTPQPRGPCCRAQSLSRGH